MNRDALVREFTSISQAVNYYTTRGYDYIIRFDGAAREKPEDWCIDGFFRFEGINSPEDNSIVYLLRRKDNTKKCIVVNSYGIYSSAHIDSFLAKLINCNGV